MVMSGVCTGGGCRVDMWCLCLINWWNDLVGKGFVSVRNIWLKLCKNNIYDTLATYGMHEFNGITNHLNQDLSEYIFDVSNLVFCKLQVYDLQLVCIVWMICYYMVDMNMGLSDILYWRLKCLIVVINLCFMKIF